MANVGQAALTVVGGVVGAFFGNPMLGAQLGNMLGQAIFPTELPTIHGPRLTDLSTMTSTYGGVIPILYGRQIRCAGNVIWSSGLIEHVKKEKAGGKGGGGEQTTVSYWYTASFAVAISIREARSIKKVWANKKAIYDVSVTEPPEGGSVYDTMVFYPGNATQLPDPTIESYLGLGETPAYRGVCYVVFTEMRLADYGNSIPTIEFEVEADEFITAGRVVEDLCRRSGVNDAAAAFIDDEVIGYAVANDSTAAAAILPLGLAYDFDMAEQYGCIRAERRAKMAFASIEIGDLGCVDAATEGVVDPVVISDRGETDLPKKVSVTYLDPDYDLQTVSQEASRTDGYTENTESLELPMVLPGHIARKTAERILWSRWAERSEARFSVSDQYARVSPGKILVLPDGNSRAPFRITRAQRGANAVIEMSGTYDDAVSYEGDLQAGGVTLPPNKPRYPGISTAMVLDAPLLRETDDFAGSYWAVTSPGTGWRGSSFQRSVDGGVSFNEVAPVAVRGGIGDVAVAVGTGTPYVFDEVNEIVVQFRYPNEQLASVTELDVLNGENVAWYGPANGSPGEIVQFQNATLIGPGQYRLTKLLRGRLGTEHAIGSHLPGDVLVVLDSALFNTAFGMGDWDKPRQYRAVSVLTDPFFATVLNHTNTGERQRPRSPVHLSATRDGSNNMTIGWVRRTRIPFSGLVAVAPLGETSESYEIDIIVAGNPVRTLTSTIQTVTYSAAQQSADGITPGNPVTFRVYQMSETRGRGRPAQSTL